MSLCSFLSPAKAPVGAACLFWEKKIMLSQCCTESHLHVPAAAGITRERTCSRAGTVLDGDGVAEQLLRRDGKVGS